MRRSTMASALAACTLHLALSACVVTATAPPSRGILVSGPPPAVIREERPPPPPAARATWIAGYWHWTGIQYAWIPGHWDAAPPMDATWHAPEYVQNNGAYFYEPGTWKPAPARSPQMPANVETFH